MQALLRSESWDSITVKVVMKMLEQA